jgi:hypothetical protein
MSKNGDYTLLQGSRYWPLALALGTATKYLVNIEEMAADKSILPIAYAKRAGQNPEAYI